MMGSEGGTSETNSAEALIEMAYSSAFKHYTRIFSAQIALASLKTIMGADLRRV